MTGISSLAQALAQIDNIKSQQTLVDLYSTQLATGKKTQKFSGLEADVIRSQRARASLKSLETYQDNIKNSQRRVELMMNAVEEFKAQASNFLDSIGNLSQESVHQKGDIVYYDDPLTTAIENTPVGMTSSDPDIDLETTIDFATRIYDLFIDILNIQDGDRYLLSGAETSVQPVSNTGTLQAAVGGLINDWKDETITTTELIADLADRTTTTNTNAITDSITGYSAELAAGSINDIFVRVDDGFELEYTVLANEEPFRDVLVAVAYVMNPNLPPIADTYEPPNTPVVPFAPDADGAPGADLDEQKDNFFSVLNALATSVSQALDDIDQISFSLSNVHGRMEEISVNHTQEEFLLRNIIGDAEDVDDNEVALKLNTIVNQLETSYAVTATVQQLSLLNFL